MGRADAFMSELVSSSWLGDCRAGGDGSRKARVSCMAPGKWSDEVEEGEEPATADVEGLRRFLEGEIASRCTAVLVSPSSQLQPILPSRSVEWVNAAYLEFCRVDQRSRKNSGNLGTPISGSGTKRHGRHDPFGTRSSRRRRQAASYRSRVRRPRRVQPVDRRR